MISVIVSVEVTLCLIWEFLLTTPSISYNHGLTRDTHTMTCVYGQKLLGLGIYTIYNAGKLFWLWLLLNGQSYILKKLAICCPQ